MEIINSFNKMRIWDEKQIESDIFIKKDITVFPTYLPDCDK